MFENRGEAGRKLAEKIKEELGVLEKEKAVILGIPRGGIVVGGEISRILNIPLRPLVTKKIPAPGNEELAIGALGEGGVIVWDEGLCQRLGVSAEYRNEILRKKLEELEKKKGDFLSKDRPLDIKDKIVMITDDGVATGATMMAAIRVVTNFFPQQIIVAVPVIAYDSLLRLKSEVDKVIYLEAPEMFFSLSQFYRDFRQVTDKEVQKILDLQ